MPKSINIWEKIKCGDSVKDKKVSDSGIHRSVGLGTILFRIKPRPEDVSKIIKTKILCCIESKNLRINLYKIAKNIKESINLDK